MIEVRTGVEFVHARRITGSPKAGTARPVTMRITRVTATTVYFKAVEDGQVVGTPSSIDRTRLHTIVREDQ